MAQITRRFRDPFYSGSIVAPSTLVPTFYEVAIDGVPYLIDWKSDQVLQYQFRYKHSTLPITRQQADSSTQPGEHTLSPDGLWRRAMESWHGGAGQSYFDRPESNPFRFNTSRGIDVWDRWKFSLLPAVQTVTDAGSWSVAPSALVSTASRLYAASGQKLSYTTDLSTWTDVTGVNASNIVSMTTDGFHIYTAQANGIGRTDTGTGAMSSAWNATVPSVIRYCNGHLLCAVGSLIQEVVSAGTTNTVYTPTNSSLTWVDFTGTTGAVYAAGVIGDRSSIYRINYDPLLGTESVTCVAELPDGEIIKAIEEYLGFVFIGTDKGWRFATPVGGPTTGFLQLGSLVTTPAAVNDFAPVGRFMYYTLTENGYSGLGRIDPSVLNTGGVPAYAADIELVDAAPATSCAAFLGYKVFTASHVYVESTAGVKVASGFIDSGQITYGLPDAKIAVSLDVRHDRLIDGGHSAYLSGNGGSFDPIGTHGATGADGETFLASQKEADRIEVRHTLTRGTDTTKTPTITRATLKSAPRVPTVLQIQVPLIMAEEVDVRNATQLRDPNADYAALLALRASQKVVQYQEYTTTWSVIVDDVLLFPGGYDQDGKQLQGTCILQLKTLDI